jgi:hypothetical protein
MKREKYELVLDEPDSSSSSNDEDESSSSVAP